MTENVSETDNVYLNIVYFMHLLRKAGVNISTAEVIDALNSLRHINLLEKKQVEIALRATLIKEASQLNIFDSAFSFFFTPNDLQSQIIEERITRKNDAMEKIMADGADLAFQGEKFDFTEDLMAVYSSLEEEEKNNIRDYLDKTGNGINVRDSFRSIIEQTLRGKLNYHKNRMASQGVSPDNPFNSENTTMQAMLDEIMQDMEERDSSLLTKDMSSISDEDMLTAARLIDLFTKKLAFLINRKYKQSNKRKHLDFKRTIRVNLKHGGIPIELKYKNRYEEKPHIVFLCDVSGSMRKYSRFLMLLMHGIGKSLASMEGFIFGDGLEKVTAYLNQSKIAVPEKIMEMIASSSKNWGKGTNINKALEKLLSDHKNDLHKSTVLLIYSDGKSEQAVQAAEKLHLIERKIKKIIWLNPVNKKDWTSIPQINTFTSVSSMFECNTIDNLQQIIRSNMGK